MGKLIVWLRVAWLKLQFHSIQKRVNRQLRKSFFPLSEVEKAG